jgi:2',3'-cyclic-nucleotide 2'-phosphodiesterase (5'-nucleotidase family)
MFSELPERLTDAIVDLAGRNDLAAVILHLNDTYQIEARPPDIPGMARIATAVQLVTSLVREATDEDRTLVVHSGDFLSPSYMTTKLGFAGKQVVDLLNCCGVDYATLGNHEFDVTPDELKQRLIDAKFTVLCANLVAPRGFPHFQSMVLWPTDRPFLAISGLVGGQTIKKATKAAFGFQPKKYHDALKEVLDRVQTKPEIGALILLTHMDRDEDKDLQELLELKWRKEAGGAFVLGGHDHDISWQEPGGNSVLSKNLSNGRTLTAVVLSKSAVAAPSKFPSWRYRSAADFVNLLRERNEKRDFSSRPGAEPFERIVDRTVTTWRESAPHNLRPDFVDAFAVRLREAAAGFARSFVENEDYLNGAERMLFQLAASFALEPFRHPGKGSGLLTLHGNPDLSELTPDAEAQHRIDGWVNAMKTQSGAHGGEVLIDFSGCIDTRLNAQDDALRTKSTDFGNFAADALELATGADLAMINSGSFRLDDMVGPALTLRDLQETFLYDHKHAVSVVDLTTDEVHGMCTYALGKSGHGAFLQVSRGFENLGARSGTIRTALVRHMLVDDEDGYQSLLASSRTCEPKEVLERIATGSTGGLVDLIMQGARMGIDYSSLNRLAGRTDSDDRQLALESFINCIDRYVAICRAQHVKNDGLLLLEFDPCRAPLSERLADERLLVRLLVMQLAMTWGIEWIRSELYGDLGRSDMQYRRTTPYHDYLDKAMTFFDFHMIHPRLKNEEGQRERPDALPITLSNRHHRASNVPSDDYSDMVSIFAERVDWYVGICGAHNVTYPECKQMLQADPHRQLPIAPLLEARFGMRHLLLPILVHYGLQRVHTDLAPRVRELDAGAGQTARYYEYLTATLSFFDIVARFGLLVNEETTD